MIADTHGLKEVRRADRQARPRMEKAAQRMLTAPVRSQADALAVLCVLLYAADFNYGVLDDETKSAIWFCRPVSLGLCTQNGGKEGRCGWLVDRYGLSWQIVPETLPRLLTSSDREAAERARQAMMDMNKIDIAVLEAAYRE